MKKGFTLLELLIVITIISVLSVFLIVAINPAETLRKARDTQRLSDLASLKTAIGIYTTTETSPQLDGISGTANDLCQNVQGTNDSTANTKIWYGTDTTISDTAFSADGQGTPVSMGLGTQVASTALGNINGTGWIPVNLGSITGGSPISNLPIDPVNSLVQPAFSPAGSTSSSASTAGAVTTAALVYRYSCAADNLTFEINAQLESIAFTSVTNGEDKRRTDGGNNDRLYEVGSALDILGAADDL